MLPYDFTKENYTKMGYLTEGVTTYYGDLMLKRSRVFTTEQYLKQVNKSLDRHFLNYGTQNLSVSDSSFDTWLDGYTRGVPNRKGSIYTEGSLVALIIDLKIRTKSKGKKSLDNVMKSFFIQKAKQKKGITNDYFKETIEIAAGATLKDLWNTLFTEKNNYFKILKDSLTPLGIKIKKRLNSDFLAARYGFYSYSEISKAMFIAPNSPASKAGLNVNDEIIAVNGIKVQKNNAKNWVKHFGIEVKLTIKKDEVIKTVQLSASTKAFFPKVRLILPIDKHNKLLKNWLGE
jgi:predicted metalloprotease with PDZ domain